MNWNSTSGPPRQLSIDGKLISKASIMASKDNSFFLNKVETIQRGIQSVPISLSSCLRIMKGKQCKLAIEHVTVAKVLKLLKSLNNSKSLGIDELDNYSIKIAAEVIAQPLHHLITLSIMQCKFPSSWKYSKIIPLHKKASKLEMKNYRPVAILSPLSKILEKIVYEQIYNYFSKNKIFHQNLHGYRKNRSTQTALLTMYDRWVRSAAAGNISGVVMIDLSAAFDLVDHDILIRKLQCYGLQNDFIYWINSYLTERYQAVWLDHILSEFLHCPTGVPQGSILGPLFFLLFFNDLPDIAGPSIDSYADDTTITESGKTVEEIEVKLNQDCNYVCHWMKSNKMKINPDKTHFFIMGTQKRLSSLGRPLKIEMDDIQILEGSSS